jgi:hypothetical protein
MEQRDNTSFEETNTKKEDLGFDFNSLANSHSFLNKSNPNPSKLIDRKHRNINVSDQTYEELQILKFDKHFRSLNAVIQDLLEHGK